MRGPFCTKLQSCDGRADAEGASSLALLFPLAPKDEGGKGPHFLLKPNIFFAKEERK